MSDINKQMAEFAKELWENYIKPKVGIEFSDTVSYYMATVVSNDGYNRVTIKRPFDDAYQVSCLDDMAGLEAGDTVLVLRFGNGTNNANHIVFGKGNGNMNYTAAAATATATEASVAAGQAAEAAAEAIESASQAADAADAAQQSALEAQESAETANQAANNALIGLATVEGVVDTVNWFAEHKTASTDTSVVPSKTYYEYNPVAGTLSAVTPEGDENPSEEGWYELSEAISNYVATHIATTNDGLYVVGLSNGWKVLVSSGTGTYTAGIFLIDPSGNIAQATTANGITFDDSKPFYIGDNNASIVFDGNGHISISGIGVSIGSTGSKSINEILTELGASIKTIEYGVGNSATSHSDITSWSSNTPEWQEDKYIWQRTTTNGLTYTYTCIQGAAGAPGAPGVSVSGVTNYYLATSQSSGVTRETTGWTTSIQTMTSTNQYLWNYEVVTGSDGSTLNTTDPVIIGRYGQDGGSGRGITGITEYYLASNQQTGITPSSSGWTTTVQTTTTATPYLWNYEVVTYSSGSPETSSARIIGTHGATGATGDPGIDFSQGKMFFDDPSFADGMNLGIYNNAGGTTVTVTRSAKSSDNPMDGTSYEVVVTSAGTASPGIGGFVFNPIPQSRANAVFIYRVIAKIPVGRNIEFTANAMGTGSVKTWLTSRAGTGYFTEYIVKMQCGATGTFSTGGHFYLDGAATSASSPVTWYVAYANMFDMTNTSDIITVQEKLDNLDIGGRNLIRRTDYSIYGSSNYTNGSYATFASDRITIPYGKEVYQNPYATNRLSTVIPSGTTITCSVYVYSQTIADGNHRLYVAPLKSDNTVFWNSNIKVIPSGFSGKLVWQHTLTEDAYGFVTDFDTRNSTSGQMILGRVKAEIGDKATDWTPAPEDITAEIEIAEETATEALNKHGFCSCSTAAGTAAKTATLSNFQLKTGSTVHVTFTNANSVANPTLNINSTGAKTIRWNNANVTAATSPWAAGECVTFVYDGTYWVVSGQSNITADNIVAGSIAADRIKANVISAVNGGTGTINADKVNAAGLTIAQSQVTGLATSLAGKEDSVTTETPTYDTDQTPYISRTSSKAIMGQESLDYIVGGTIAWNQLVSTLRGDFNNTTINVSGTVSGLTYTFSGTPTTDNDITTKFNTTAYIVGHVYHLQICPRGGSSTTYYGWTTGGVRDYGNGVIFKATTTGDNCNMHFKSGVNMDGKSVAMQSHDLTQMLGVTIADYINTLETANKGAGLEWVKKYLDLTSEQPYNAGELKSVSGLSSHDTTGKNLVDYSAWKTVGIQRGVGVFENNGVTLTATAADCFTRYTYSEFPEGARISIKEGETITFTWDVDTNDAAGSVYIFPNGTTTGMVSVNNAVKTLSYTATQGVTYVTFRVSVSASGGVAHYKNIMIRKRGNSDFAPYFKNTYPLDSAIILRGAPQLAGTELQYNGDYYYPDGSISRRYGIVNLGTLTWTMNTTSGFSVTYSALKPGQRNMICTKYPTGTVSFAWANIESLPDKTIYWNNGNTNNTLYVKDTSYTTAAALQSAMNNVYLVYEKATITSETAVPYQQTQMADAGGTEEFVTTNITPVGHLTTYPTNLRASIDSLPVDTTDAARTATNYITNISSGGGITVTGNGATGKVHITQKVRVQADTTHFTDVESDGMRIYAGSSTVPVARFLASGSRISSDTTHYTEFDSNSWTIYGGTDSPTITAQTYPVTASQATTSMAKLTISNSARTKELIRLWTNKVTVSSNTYESPGIAVMAYETGSAAVLLNTGRLSDGSTAGGGITINGLGTTNAAVDMMSDVVTVNGTQKAGGMVRVHYGTATISKAAQLRTYGQLGAPSLEFYNTSGTLQSWYGINYAYIYRESGYAGYAAHGKSTDHKYTFEWSSISGYNYLRFYVDTVEVYRLQQQSYSDRRVKKDIEPIQCDYKDAVGAVNITQFRYDFDNETLKDADGIMFGIIAQDLIEELDDKGISYTDTPLVSDMGEDEESLYSVNYTQFLLARIAHDEDRIQKLEEQNHKLEEQNKALEERLSVLEDIMLKNLIRDIDET